MEKTDIKNLDWEQLQSETERLGQKPFRGRQIYEWLHQKLAVDFSGMTNLPADLRARLAEEYRLTALTTLRVQTSKLDGTQKYLFGLADGNAVESVLMRYHHGNSVCVSSQVGCRMGCTFCASTLKGLTRNLTAAEMLDQVYRIQAITGERASNVVVMGTGEPLDNYENLVKFIRMLTDGHGLGISQRNVTVSTCGIVPAMRRLAGEGLQVTLALSLHAATQEKRRELMPIANKYELSEVMEACDEYFDRTGRRITFEYSLMGGVNDSEKDAAKLAALAKRRNHHVNLIPVNPVKERDFVQPGQKTIRKFKNYLEKCGRNVSIRREMGRDINGACGQLRNNYIESSKTQ